MPSDTATAYVRRASLQVSSAARGSLACRPAWRAGGRSSSTVAWPKRHARSSVRRDWWSDQSFHDVPGQAPPWLRRPAI